MKITVRFTNKEIIYDESDNNGTNSSTNGKSTIKWSDQMKNIHDTIVVMVDQCNRLK